MYTGWSSASSTRRTPDRYDLQRGVAVPGPDCPQTGRRATAVQDSHRGGIGKLKKLNILLYHSDFACSVTKREKTEVYTINSIKKVRK